MEYLREVGVGILIIDNEIIAKATLVHLHRLCIYLSQQSKFAPLRCSPRIWREKNIIRRSSIEEKDEEEEEEEEEEHEEEEEEAETLISNYQTV